MDKLKNNSRRFKRKDICMRYARDLTVWWWNENCILIRIVTVSQRRHIHYGQVSGSYDAHLSPWRGERIKWAKIRRKEGILDCRKWHGQRTDTRIPRRPIYRHPPWMTCLRDTPLFPGEKNPACSSEAEWDWVKVVQVIRGMPAKDRHETMLDGVLCNMATHATPRFHWVDRKTPEKEIRFVINRKL